MRNFIAEFADDASEDLKGQIRGAVGALIVVSVMKVIARKIG